MTALVAQLRVELRLTLRRGESVLVSMVIPAGLLVFFSTVRLLPLGTHPVRTLLPGTLAVAIIATSMVTLGIATGYERHYGVLKRLGGTPLGRTRLLAAKMMSVVAIEFLQILLLLAIAALLGYRGGIDPLTLTVASLIGTAAFSGIGLLMAGRLRAEANLALVNGLFMLFVLVGGTLIPASRLPHPLAVAARALPAEALTTLMHAATSGHGPQLVPLTILAAWAAAATLVAMATFSWD